LLKGYLQIITLKILSQKPCSGYELIKEIKAETGGWKPSYGSMYPLLEHFLKDGIVKVKQLQRKKIYTLTEKGKKHLKMQEQKKNEMIDRMIEGMKMYELFSSKTKMELIVAMMQRLKEGKVPFQQVNPEVEELKFLLVKLLVQNKIEKNKNALKIILQKTNRELKQLL